jgi:transposase
MRTPIFVRPLTAEEQTQLQAGLHSPDAFTLRRCQILLASARGERVPQIATWLGCDEQTVRNAIYAFNQHGGVALHPASRRPHQTGAAFSPAAAERLRGLLHQSPRRFDFPTSVWTLALAAEISFAQGLTPERVSDETIRATLARLGVSWRRAKAWITSPDPAYQRKKGPETA